MRLVLSNVHTPYLYSLCRIGIPILSLLEVPTDWQRWNSAERPKPSNLSEIHVTEYKKERGDIFIAQTPSQINFFKRFSGPKVYIEHNRQMGVRYHYAPRDFYTVFVGEHVKETWIPSHNRWSVIEVGIPDEFFEYNGRNKEVLSVVHHWQERDWCCRFSLWRRVTQNLPVRIVGKNPFSKPAKDWNELRRIYAESRVYFHTTISFTCMALREALVSGMPVVTTLQNIPFENEKEILVGRNEIELREKLLQTLDNLELCKEIGKNARRKALSLFNIDTFVSKWREVLEAL